ncbi:MAG: sigma-54-dependent Fis family transcriptional regulator, partial [Pirellulaceae bacterium]|nr:sigma-54-dependent Fis family transcriptional regulator [Pirellulaceae bacterium]
ELQGVLRKSLLNLTGPILVPDFLPEEVHQTPPRAEGASASKEGDSSSAAYDLKSFLEGRLTGSQDLYAEAIEFMERYVVMRVLQTTGGNQSRAAKILGITRGSLRNKTHALGIKIDQVISHDSESDEE